jgi:hypothetical protein
MKSLAALILVTGTVGAMSTWAQPSQRFDPAGELGVSLGAPLETVLSIATSGGFHLDRIDTNVGFNGATIWNVVAHRSDEHVVYSLSVGRINGLIGVSREERSVSHAESETEFAERCASFTASLGKPTLHVSTDDVARCYWGLSPGEPTTGTVRGVMRATIDDGETTGNRQSYLIVTVVYDLARENAESRLQML